MSHSLDRPIWQARATGWSAMALDARARRLDPAYGAADAGTEIWADLAARVPIEGER